jgi:hypothetical protein
MLVKINRMDMMLFLESMVFVYPSSLLAHLSGSQADVTMDWQESFLLISFRVFDMKASILSVVCVFLFFLLRGGS